MSFQNGFLLLVLLVGGILLGSLIVAGTGFNIFSGLIPNGCPYPRYNETSLPQALLNQSNGQITKNVNGTIQIYQLKTCISPTTLTTSSTTSNNSSGNSSEGIFIVAMVAMFAISMVSISAMQSIERAKKLSTIDCCQDGKKESRSFTNEKVN